MPTLYPIDAVRTQFLDSHGFLRLTEDLCKARHQTCAKAGFKRRKSRVIDKTQNDFSHVEGLANVRIDEIKQVFGRVAWRSGIVVGNLLRYLRRQSQCPLTSLANRVDPIHRQHRNAVKYRLPTDSLIYCKLVGKASQLRMSLGATQDFCINDLASRHFDQWWATEKDLCLVFDKDAIVGKGWVVRSACC
jgi:hypothetical protein